MRKVRISKKFLASFGSGSPAPEEDDDLEFFDVEEPAKPTVVVYGKFPNSVTTQKWRCLWCFVERFADERGRFSRCHCGRLGVTKLEMKDKRHIYVESSDE